MQFSFKQPLNVWVLKNRHLNI